MAKVMLTPTDKIRKKMMTIEARKVNKVKKETRVAIKINKMVKQKYLSHKIRARLILILTKVLQRQK